MKPMSVRSFGRTETGKRRHLNEDAILIRDEIGLWAVADGLGGHSAGDYASNLIVERLRMLPFNGDPCLFIDAIEDTLEGVNADLLRTARDRGCDLIGSTAVILFHHASMVFCGWVGDSRGYRFDTRRLQQITEDHVQDCRADLTHHGQTSGALTRAVGADPQLFMDWTVNKVRGDATYILCSDGINKEIDDRELDRECARALDPRELVCQLFAMALSRAARDNLSAIVVQFSGVAR